MIFKFEKKKKEKKVCMYENNKLIKLLIGNIDSRIVLISAL